MTLDDSIARRLGLFCCTVAAPRLSPLFSLLVTILVYCKTMGEIAGNIIAAIPAVQQAVKIEIASGSNVVIAISVTGRRMASTQASEDAPTNENSTSFGFCPLLIRTLFKLP